MGHANVVGYLIDSPEGLEINGANVDEHALLATANNGRLEVLKTLIIPFLRRRKVVRK